MSLFKSRTWWSTCCGSQEEFDRGCLCVADIDNTGSVKIITGSFQGFLRIYNPKQRDFQPGDLLLEQQLGAPILQIEAGRFLPNNSIALAVLHPRQLAVYLIQGVTSEVQQGCYYTMNKHYQHNLSHTTYNFVYGPFGGVYDKDYFCVQSIDGILFFYEQDNFAFSRFLHNFLLPGPLLFFSKLDSIVTYNSTFELECYRYQSMAAGALRGGSEDGTDERPIQVEWKVNLGEPIWELHVARFSRSLGSSQLDIIALGERSLFCIKEGGGIRSQKLLGYNPSCVWPYIPVLSEEEVYHNLLIGTHFSSLMIYSDMQLVWAAHLQTTPVAVRVATFGNLKGLLVFLDENGLLSLEYLGTDPSSHVVNRPVESKEPDFESMEKEMRKLEANIKELTSAKRSEPSDRLELSVQVVPSTAMKGSCATCEIRMEASFTGAGFASNVRLGVSVPKPFKASQSVFTLEALSSPTSVTVSIRSSSRCLPLSLDGTATASCVLSGSQARTVHAPFTLPFCMCCQRCSPPDGEDFQVVIETNRPPCSLEGLFLDVPQIAEDEDSSKLIPKNVVSFRIFSGQFVSITSGKNREKNGVYQVACNSFLGAMSIVLDQLLERLESHFLDSDSNSEEFKVIHRNPLPVKEYFKIVDVHFLARKALREISEKLSDLSSLFRALQKRLLIRFKDRNAVANLLGNYPVNSLAGGFIEIGSNYSIVTLHNLDVLLDETYNSVIATSNEYAKRQGELRRASSDLSSSTYLMQRLFRCHYSLDASSYKMLKNYLSCSVDDRPEQGWEEVTDMSLRYLISRVKGGSDTAPSPSDFPENCDPVKQAFRMLTQWLDEGKSLGNLFPEPLKKSKGKKKTQSQRN